MTPEDLTVHTPDPPDETPDIAAQLAHYRLMVENVADVIVRLDASRRRTYVSPASRDMLGYAPEEMVGGTAFGLVHPDDRDKALAVLTKLSAVHPVLDLVFRMRRKDGAYLWVEGRYRHIPEDGGLLSVLRDITAHKKAEEMLAEANEKLAQTNMALQAMVHRDSLTGLANRRCFDIQLVEEFRRAQRQAVPLALILVDVDDFKRFNDCHGHLAGDGCLRRIAAAVEGVLCRPGDLAARYGGEELVILLPATDEAGALMIAEHIRQAVAALRIPHAANAHGFVTVSAGACALTPTGDGDTPSDLIAAADRALYQAKQAGRNLVRAAMPIGLA
jgi:diguanylate cyclase (GGDEF)-like protein/PAS domain S-box-containing protein